MILPSGNRVFHFETIDSTNLEASRLASRGEVGPLWLWSDEQTGGKGRLGRKWISKPGNLYATFLFATHARPEAVPQLSFVAALAVHDVVEALLPANVVAIKWPNDVLIGGAKVSGILAEVVSANPLTVALGCGVNIAHAPDNMPYPVTALANNGASPKPEAVLRKLDTALSARLKAWDHGRGSEKIRHAWEQAASGIGHPAEVRTGSETLTGIIRGLASDGALILELPNKSRRLIHAGEVRLPEKAAVT